MKLKKIASLALAGVMAVSMLAGCATKAPETDNNEGTEVETSTIAIAAALNGAQTEVTFTDDAALNAALQNAVTTLGVNGFTTVSDLKTEIIKQTGIGGTVGGLNATVTATPSTDLTAEGEDAVTVLTVKAYQLGNFGGVEGLLLMKATDDVKNAIEDLDLPEDSSTGKHQGDTYYKYSYTGKSAVVTAKDASGAVYYLVATAITRTSTADKI